MTRLRPRTTSGSPFASTCTTTPSRREIRRDCPSSQSCSPPWPPLPLPLPRTAQAMSYPPDAHKGDLPDADAIKERQREEQELAEALAEEDEF